MHQFTPPDMLSVTRSEPKAGSKAAFGVLTTGVQVLSPMFDLYPLNRPAELNWLHWFCHHQTLVQASEIMQLFSRDELRKQWRKKDSGSTYLCLFIGEIHSIMCYVRKHHLPGFSWKLTAFLHKGICTLECFQHNTLHIRLSKYSLWIKAQSNPCDVLWDLRKEEN